MRWTWGRDPGTCTTCGATLDRATMWCGACGARTDAQPVVADEPEIEASAGDAPERTGIAARWVTGSLVVAIMATLVAAAVLRPAVGEPLLGRTDTDTGVTSSELPPVGLEVAWAGELQRPFGWMGAARRIVVGDGLVRNGHLTVDLATGRVVAASQHGAWTDHRHNVRLAGREFVVVDTLTGAIEVRGEAEVDLPQPAWVVVRSDDTMLVAGEHGAVLLRNDGTAVAELPGQTMLGFGDDARSEPAALPLRDVGERREYTDAPTGALELVRVADGETLLRRDDGTGTVVADVVGDTALVSWSARPGHADSEWELDVVDATDGTVLSNLRIGSAEVPRLLGVGPDGEAVLAGRIGRTVTVWSLDGDRLTVVAEGETPASYLGAGFYREDSAALSTAVLTDDGLVATIDGGEIVARTLDGRVIWRADGDGVTALAASGGVVALVPREASNPEVDVPPTVLLDATDGQHLVTLPQMAGGWGESWGMHAAAVHDGHVGISNGGGWPGSASVMRLPGSTWLDLRSGERTTVRDLFEPWASEIGAAVLSWRFHRTVVDDTGAEFPVLTFEDQQGELRVLEADGVHIHDLDVPTYDERGYGGFHTESVGASAQHLAVWGQSWSDEGQAMATFVIDRTTGEVTTIPDIAGTALVGDLLIGLEFDPMTWQDATMVAIDVTSGERRWATPWSDRRFEAAQRHDHELLLTGDGVSVAALAVDSGEVLWEHEASHELLTARVLGATSVLVATVGGEVVALDRTTGQERWRTDVGAPVLSLRGAGGGAVVGTIDGDVVVLDEDGGEVDRVRLSAPVVDAAALGDTVVALVGRQVIGLRSDGTGLTQLDEVPVPERS